MFGVLVKLRGSDAIRFGIRDKELGRDPESDVAKRPSKPHHWENSFC